MILEGIVTTINVDGSVNISPMGPIVDAAMATLLLRPFQTSTTYQNLKRTGHGVFHVTDDVELLARAAIGRVDPCPAMHPAAEFDGYVLSDACRWYAFIVDSIDDAEPRTSIHCRVLDQGRQRDFFGFNRAKHAVVEAAILATRVHLLSIESIREQMGSLATIVDKTAGDQERRAFALLQSYIDEHDRREHVTTG